MVNVSEFLGVAVNKGEPGALDLDHDPVSFLKAVAFVSEVVFDVCDFPGNKRLRVFKAVAVFAPEHVRTNTSAPTSIWKCPILTPHGLGLLSGASPG